MKKLFVFINIIMLYSFSLYASEFCVYNPHPTKIKGLASIELASLGVSKSNTLKLKRIDNGKILPCQIIAKDGKSFLLTTLELKALETVRLKFVKDNSKVTSLVNSTADNNFLKIDTPFYTIVLNKKKGYTIKSLRDKQGGKIPSIAQAELIFSRSGEQKKYNGYSAKTEKCYYQSRSKVTCKILYKGKLETQIELLWKFDAGAVRDTITFNGVNRLVRHDVELTFSKVMVQGEYRISMPYFSKGKATVFPQKERYPERTFDAPGYEFAYNSIKKYGIGLIAPAGQPLLNFFWQLTGKSEGVGYDRNKLSLFTNQFRYTKLPGKFNFSFAIIAGGYPSSAKDYTVVANDFREFKSLPLNNSQSIVKSVKFSKPFILGLNNFAQIKLSSKADIDAAKINNIPLTINKLNSTFKWQPAKIGDNKLEIIVGKKTFTYNINVKKIALLKKLKLDKIVYKPNKQANTTFTVTNNATSSEKFKLVSSVISNINKREIVKTQNISLAALENKKIKISWNSGAEKKGITFEVKLYHNKKMIDIVREYASVTSFAPDSGQYSVANPGWFKKAGQEKIYIKNLRNNYFSFFEYYCWTSCPMTGLTPKKDIWNAQTESQVSYEAKISKKFIKKFVKVAHNNGISVFPWMNGEVALPTGLDHPEYYRYGKNGQPLLYNGAVKNGKRYAIAYTSALYNPDAAYKWGQEMAKSIDMFGWDGCRFDWAFTPHVVGDPMRAKKSEWYNHLGISSRKLFPDHDAAGTKALQAFRKGIAETHPEFIYGANSSGGFGDEVIKLLPKYKAESSINSWLWFEYLLSYTNKKSNTWQKWSKLLTEDSWRARKNGSQIGVGWMRMYPSGAVSAKIIPYLILYSGLHWIGSRDRTKSLGENWKVWRYALRFSKYFYGSDFILMPAEKRLETISVSNSPRLLWKQLIFEKKDKNGRSLLVNMINLPKGDYISERHEPPQPLKNIALTFNKKRAEKVKRIVMLNAEPKPHSVELKSKTVDNMVTVIIPEIKLATSILIETEKD